MACAARTNPPTSPGALRALACLLLLLPGGFSESCDAYTDPEGNFHAEKACPEFCCGSCSSRYCCSDLFQKLSELDQLLCPVAPSEREFHSGLEERMKFKTDFDDFDYGPGGTVIGIMVAIAAVFIVTIILCFTCSCCCLYKACRRRPPPIVSTTTATVVQVPYPQQPGMPQGYPTGPPQGYPAGPYQGYSPVPVQPQPGGPVAPYPTQYPPPYPTQPTGPPAYHEAMAGAAAAQPPYNPAYMDSSKPAF